MHLFNRYWSRRDRSLRPTAGYTTDARRWMYQIGSGAISAWEDDLLRNGTRPD